MCTMTLDMLSRGVNYPQIDPLYTPIGGAVNVHQGCTRSEPRLYATLVAQVVVGGKMKSYITDW
jgi:hypothetical protein